MTFQGVWLIFSSLVFFCFVTSNGGETIWESVQTKLRFRRETAVPNTITIPLKITSDSLPLSEITIGSSSKPYKMIFGSWFSGSWVFSKEACKKNTNAKAMCKKIQTYDDTNLSDENKKKQFTATHLGGEVKGYYIKTNIKIGDIVLQNQDVGIVTKWDKLIADGNKNGQYDGYFGILCAFDNGQIVESPIFKSLIAQKKIKTKIFGLYLNLAKKVGELTLGGINSQYINGDENSLRDVQIESGGTKGWLINVESIKVGPAIVGTNLKAYVDPSTTFFAGKTEIITKINEKLGATGPIADGYFKFSSCDKGQSFPEVQFTINKKVFTLGSSSTRVQVPGVLWNMSCGSTFTIQKSIEGYDLFLGSIFLNNVYTVFDVAGKKLRLAEVATSKL